jgi:hypothetical protein
MKIGDKLLKVLSKRYEPDQMISKKFGRYELDFKTDHDGNPVLLFIGDRTENGRIKGHRFARVLLQDPQGNLIKDHWDAKGKV